MNLTAEMAEVIGVLLGDGCLSKYYSRSEKTWRREIAFTGSNDDFYYYKEFVQPVFMKHFGVAGRLFIRKDNSTRFHVKSRTAFDFFSTLGIPIGKKPPSLEIPQELLTNQTLSLACVRGLWNTDGTIYRRYTKQYPSQKRNYPNYLVMDLKMYSRPVLEQVKTILGKADIKTTNITKNNNCFVLRIAAQQAILRYMAVIGFSNQHHTKRISKFNELTNNNLNHFLS